MSEHLSLVTTSDDGSLADDRISDGSLSDTPLSNTATSNSARSNSSLSNTAVSLPLTRQRATSTKTLSQFPAALVPTLQGLPISQGLSQGARPITFRGHPFEHVAPPQNNFGQTRSVTSASVNTPWSYPLRALCFANPVGESRGAGCAIWALAEMLRDLPAVDRSAMKLALTEINTRGEVLLALTPPASFQVFQSDEAELVWELIGWLQAAAVGVEDCLEEDAASPFAGSGVSPHVFSGPSWLSELQDIQAQAPLSTLDELSDWLEAHLRVPREQQAQEIGRWARQHRRLSQSREGQLIEQLGFALTRLSVGPVPPAPPKFDAWKWLASAALMAMTVGIASRLLIR